MTDTNETNETNETKLHLYDDILRMVEEEVYQRKTSNGYVDHNTTEMVKQSGGGNSKSNGIIPGKFEAIRYSMEPPINVALRGTVARQMLFAKESDI